MPKNKTNKIINHDPIIIRTKKKIKKSKQPINSSEDEQESSDQQDQFAFNKHLISLKQTKTNDYYSQFKSNFCANQDSQSLEQAKQEQFLQKCIKARSDIKSQSKPSQFKNIAKYHLTISTKQPFNHFDKDYQDIIAKYLQSDDQAKVDTLKQVESKLQELFQHDIQEQQFATNTKNLQMKPQFKRKSLVEINDIQVEDYMLDQLLQDQTLTQNQFILNTTEEEIQENDQRDSLFYYAMRNFIDIIHIDPEEENSQWFRNHYTKHILDHIQKLPSSEESPHKGFTRCKVLILCPFRGDAIEIINNIIEQYTDQPNKIKNYEKYQEEYLDEDRALDDDFRIGIALFPKKFIKLYSPFDKSDIIIASPLGLKLITESETHFLSSIEICIIDRASAIFMQNWNHLTQLLTQLNCIPEHKYITSELLLIRPYFFEGLSKFYRQTIIYSDHYFTQLNQVRANYMNNYKGCLSNRLYYLQVVKDVEQEFVNFDVANIQGQFEQRFSVFKKYWNNIEQEQQFRRMVVFVSSYFDFVKLKNHLKSVNSSMECLSEYTPKNKVQGIVARFNKNKINYLMITERAYFFEVCQIKKMKHLLFYQLPCNQFIYKSLFEGIYDDKEKKQVELIFNQQQLDLE